mgnify:CR=1 FL=1
MPIRNRFAELHPEITAWRRDLHEYPELQYDLPRTAGIVADNPIPKKHAADGRSLSPGLLRSHARTLSQR